MILFLFIRLASWTDAQRQCESENMTLLQYNSEQLPVGLTSAHFNKDFLFGDVMFLGLKKDTKV